MIRHKRVITVYELENGYFVEVRKQNDLIEFYLGSKKDETKILMFGMSELYGMSEEELITANVTKYINLYYKLLS